MSVRDRLLAALVVIVWGVNFTVIKFGVDGVPPMLLVMLRFTFAAFPAIFFVKRPAIPWPYVVAYGMTVGIGQFSCLFYAMYSGMPAGVASVVLQAQAFFTILLAALFCGERLGLRQFVGLVLAALGLWCISGRFDSAAAAPIPVVPFIITLGGAFFWGLSNIVVQKASAKAAGDGQKLNVLSLVIWSSLVPPLPMLALSLWLEKPAVIVPALLHISGLTIFSIAYLAFLATIFGYGMWSRLLAKYPTQKIAPLSLLVPVTGMITASLVLQERLTIWQGVGSILIIVGLLLLNLRTMASQK